MSDLEDRYSGVVDEYETVKDHIVVHFKDGVGVDFAQGVCNGIHAMDGYEVVRLTAEPIEHPAAPLALVKVT